MRKITELAVIAAWDVLATALAMSLPYAADNLLRVVSKLVPITTASEHSHLYEKIQRGMRDAYH